MWPHRIRNSINIFTENDWIFVECFGYIMQLTVHADIDSDVPHCLFYVPLNPRKPEVVLFYLLEELFKIKNSSDKVDVGPVKENMFIKWKTFPLTDV